LALIAPAFERGQRAKAGAVVCESRDVFAKRVLVVQTFSVSCVKIQDFSPFVDAASLGNGLN